MTDMTKVISVACMRQEEAIASSFFGNTKMNAVHFYLYTYTLDRHSLQFAKTVYVSKANGATNLLRSSNLTRS